MSDDRAEPRAAPGWYGDPWQVAPWRWFDGSLWTSYVAGAPPAEPRRARLYLWLWGVGLLLLGLDGLATFPLYITVASEPRPHGYQDPAWVTFGLRGWFVAGAVGTICLVLGIANRATRPRS